MSTVSHEPAASGRSAWIHARNMWASLAITSVWVVTALTALWGPDIESFDVGGNTTRIPSGVVFALFALFATRSIAKYGFERQSDG